MSYLLTVSTCPDLQTAERLGAALLERHLIACVNILPGAISMYEWKGKVEREHECVLLMKTRADAFDALREAVVELHPYELPEIIGVPIEQGLSDYLTWIDEQVDKNQ
jgi:periplasmic divalent cation tolerance protein